MSITMSEVNNLFVEIDISEKVKVDSIVKVSEPVEETEPQVNDGAAVGVPSVPILAPGPSSLGTTDASSGISWVDSSDTPRINIFSYAVQGAAYFLPDAGDIEFFINDKPMEFYGQHACLVRNCHVPGNYVIRVPGNTPVYRIADYKEMFESRLPIKVRNGLYIAGSPYVHEREVGVNCGILDRPESPESEMFQESLDQPQSGSIYTSPVNDGDSSYFDVPNNPHFAVYPELINRVQSYIDTTASAANSSLAGSDECIGDGSIGGSSGICPGSANGFYPQHHGSLFNNIAVDFGFENAPVKKVDLRANSGGYGRMFSTTDKPREPPVYDPIVRRYNQQHINFEDELEVGGGNGDAGLPSHGHGQHGPFIPVIPARVAGDTPVSLPPRHLNKKTNALYKTEMCRNWNEIGECRYGRSCQFAHGKKELRTVPRHGQWKTKTCMAWLHGGCTYGSRCCYAHEVIDDNGRSLSFPKSTDHGTSATPDNGESKFSEFFASRCWA